MSTLILIPARMASTRLPGKPLADIAGKPMIVLVAARAAEAADGSVESSDTTSSAPVGDHSRGPKGDPSGGAPRPKGRGGRGANIHVRQQGRTGR